MMKTKVVKLSSVLLTLSLLVACGNNASTSSQSTSSSSTSPSSSSTTPVVEKALSSIEIGTKPSKVEYQLGESLDVTGGIILAKYQDGTQDNIGITKEMVAVSDISTEGTKTVTVSYTYKGVTKTTSYEVTYKAKALQVSVVSFDKDT